MTGNDRPKPANRSTLKQIFNSRAEMHGNSCIGLPDPSRACCYGAGSSLCFVFIWNISVLNIRCYGNSWSRLICRSAPLLCSYNFPWRRPTLHCIFLSLPHNRVTLISRCVMARFAAFFFRLHARRRGLLVGYNYCFEVFSCALASDLAPIRAAFASFTQTSLSLPALSSHFSLATE